MIKLESRCQMFALPSIAPEAKILEFLELYRARIADFGFAFCVFIKIPFFHMYRQPSDPPVMAISLMKIIL